jgi:hypothetical protein
MDDIKPPTIWRRSPPKKDGEDKNQDQKRKKNIKEPEPKKKKSFGTRLKGAARQIISANYSRINNITATLIIVVAFLLFDLTQIILEWLLIGFLFNWIITSFAWLTMWFWFKLHNVSFIASPSRLVTMLVAAIIDYIPGTDASIILGFTWTIGTFIIILIVRIEDITGINFEAIKLNFDALDEKND